MCVACGRTLFGGGSFSLVENGHSADCKLALQAIEVLSASADAAEKARLQSESERLRTKLAKVERKLNDVERCSTI
jgi:hypothetical protein